MFERWTAAKETAAFGKYVTVTFEAETEDQYAEISVEIKCLMLYVQNTWRGRYTKKDAERIGFLSQTFVENLQETINPKHEGNL